MKIAIFVVLYLVIGIQTSSDLPISPCIAIDTIDDLFEEQWDFSIPFWENTTISLVTSQYNQSPMEGTYTYVYSFCHQLNVYIGDYTKNQTTFGWSYGSMATFYGWDAMPDYPPDDANTTAYLEFSMGYINGDSGSPCTDDIPRTAIVNLYCGFDRANCSTVPGNTGPQCLNSPSTTKPGFCLCGIIYNGSLCNGLEINLLSNHCPRGYTIPLVVPLPPVFPIVDNARSVGIVIAVLTVFFFGSMTAGFIYNMSVHSKRGCSAIPFYDTCTGKEQKIVYESPQAPQQQQHHLEPEQQPSYTETPPPVTPTYGSI